MKIHLAKSAGFCSGVKRALEIALNTARTEQKVYMLGDIVHNEDVINEIAKSGIHKISRLSKKGMGKTLLIRAHGASIGTFKNAAKYGYNIIDATCPMVKEIHKTAKKMEQKGYTIILIGDQKHDEVRGIVGQLKKNAVIIDEMKNIPFKKLKRIKQAAVLCQSTQKPEKALEIFNILKQYINRIKFFNTVCRPTRTKQEEIKRMPLINDAMIIIGSRTSANTRRLYEISKSLNKNTYWLHSAKDIVPAWFKNAKNVGVTSGASTPEWITTEIITRLKKFSHSK